MAAEPHLSVVIPVRDEIDSLEPLHRELDLALADVPGGVEILFVDDASRDGSRGRLLDLAAKDRRVRVLALDRHAGQSAALMAGFRAARGALVAMLDADLQNDPADLPRLLEAIARGADVAQGVRTRRRDPIGRRAVSWLANRVRDRVTGDHISDVGCSLRVMRAGPLRRLPPFGGMHRFLPTLLRLEGARVVELPVAHRPRRYGRSKVGNWERLRHGLTDVVGVRWLVRRRLHTQARELEPRP